MKKTFSPREMWSNHQTQYGISTNRDNFVDFNTFVEDAKDLFKSTVIGAKVFQILGKLTQINKPSHVDITAVSKRAFLYRTAAAIGWSFIAQLLLAIQFHILVNINYNLMGWKSDMITGIKSILYMEHLIPTSICIIGYNFLIAHLYMVSLPLCSTRSDRIFYVGSRKLLLLVAQLILSLWYFHIYYPQTEVTPHILYVKCAVIFVTLYNFWTLHLFKEFELNFDLVVIPGYEKLCLILRPSFFNMFRRVCEPLWKFTITYFLIVNIDDLVGKYQYTGDGWAEFTLTTIDIRTVFQTLLITALTQQAILTLEHLIQFKLTQPMEFAVKDETGKALLLEALERRDLNRWIYNMAARDFVFLSQNEQRYQDIWILPYQEKQYLWEDISGLSLEIVRQYIKALGNNYECPEKLLDTDLVETALNDNNTQHIFKRINDRNIFIISLTKAPTLCSCPLGPTRPMLPKLGRYLRTVFWFHIVLAYKLLMSSKIIHLWHFFFCPTFGVKVRHLLRDSESIEALLHAVTNVCIAAFKENKRHVIKCTMTPFIKTLLDAIQITKMVPYNRHDLYGLNAEAYGKLKSLKSYAKSSLFRLLLCYEDQLMLFVQDDIIQEITPIIGLYKWPIKLHKSKATTSF